MRCPPGENSFRIDSPHGIPASFNQVWLCLKMCLPLSRTDNADQNQPLVACSYQQFDLSLSVSSVVKIAFLGKPSGLP
jgi:hypothetical protein